MKFQVFQKSGRWIVIDRKSQVTCHTTLSGAMDYACSQDRTADQSGTPAPSNPHGDSG